MGVKSTIDLLRAEAEKRLVDLLTTTSHPEEDHPKADEKITMSWCATATAWALKHGDIIAKLDAPLLMHLEMEPGTDGYGGTWRPVRDGKVSSFPDADRLSRAMDDAKGYPFELTLGSVQVHVRKETVVVTYDPPIPETAK